MSHASFLLLCLAERNLLWLESKIRVDGIKESFVSYRNTEEIVPGTNCPRASWHFPVSLAVKCAVNWSSMIRMRIEVWSEAAKNRCKFSTDAWKTEASGFLRRHWRTTKPLTPDLHQIMVWASRKSCSLSGVILNYWDSGVCVSDLWNCFLEIIKTKIFHLNISKISTLKDILENIYNIHILYTHICTLTLTLYYQVTGEHSIA